MTGEPELIDGDPATCPAIHGPNTFYPVKVGVAVNMSNLCLQGNTFNIDVMMQGKGNLYCKTACSTQNRNLPELFYYYDLDDVDMHVTAGD